MACFYLIVWFARMRYKGVNRAKSPLMRNCKSMFWVAAYPPQTKNVNTFNLSVRLRDTSISSAMNAASYLMQVSAGASERNVLGDSSATLQ